MAGATALRDPNVDIDRITGETIRGWPQVVQSLGDIFAQRFGERYAREWYGSLVPQLLGENLNEETVGSFFRAVGSAVSQWEPRFRVIQITPLSVDRTGAFRLEIRGAYRPRALLGDFTETATHAVTILGTEAGLAIEP